MNERRKRTALPLSIASYSMARNCLFLIWRRRREMEGEGDTTDVSLVVLSRELSRVLVRICTLVQAALRVVIVHHRRRRDGEFVSCLIVYETFLCPSVLPDAGVVLTCDTYMLSARIDTDSFQGACGLFVSSIMYYSYVIWYMLSKRCPSSPHVLCR